MEDKIEKFKEDIEIKNNHIDTLRKSNKEYQETIESLGEFIQAIDIITLHSDPLPRINKMLDAYFGRV